MDAFLPPLSTSSSSSSTPCLVFLLLLLLLFSSSSSIKRTLRLPISWSFPPCRFFLYKMMQHAHWITFSCFVCFRLKCVAGNPGENWYLCWLQAICSYSGRNVRLGRLHILGVVVECLAEEGATDPFLYLDSRESILTYRFFFYCHLLLLLPKNSKRQPRRARQRTRR